MDALRTRPNEIADAIDEALSAGGERAGRSIEEAARKVNEAGAEAGSVFSRMLEGLGRRMGEEQARAFNSNVRPIPISGIGLGGVSGNPGRMPGPGIIGSEVSGERGRIMPNAGIAGPR